MEKRKVKQRTMKVKNKVTSNTRERCIFERCYLIEGVLAPVRSRLQRKERLQPSPHPMTRGARKKTETKTQISRMVQLLL